MSAINHAAIPPSFKHLAGIPAGPQWLLRKPTASRCCRRRSLTRRFGFGQFGTNLPHPPALRLGRPRARAPPPPPALAQTVGGSVTAASESENRQGIVVTGAAIARRDYTATVSYGNR